MPELESSITQRKGHDTTIKFSPLWRKYCSSYFFRRLKNIQQYLLRTLSTVISASLCTHRWPTWPGLTVHCC